MCLVVLQAACDLGSARPSMNGLSGGGRSLGRSRKGSYAGSHAGSYVGSHVGSHPGSHVGSHAGSHHGSLPGSRAGSHVGSHSSGSSPGGGPQRFILLRNSLAITLRRTGSVGQVPVGPLGPHCGREHLPGAPENDFWMYDNGYLLFQVRGPGLD